MARAFPASEWRHVVIIGVGGHGKEVHSYVNALAAHGAPLRVKGFVDDFQPPGSFAGTEVLGDLDFFRRHAQQSPAIPLFCITAIGANEARRDLVERVSRLGLDQLAFLTVQHPSAIVGSEVEIGEGSCLAPGSIVTTHAVIGKHCILNVNASVSHDTVVGDFVNLNPGAAVGGNVSIGTGCYIGAGATVIDNITIGEWTVVGAGAVVIRDLPDHATAVGVPARVIKRSGNASA